MSFQAAGLEEAFGACFSKGPGGALSVTHDCNGCRRVLTFHYVFNLTTSFLASVHTCVSSWCRVRISVISFSLSVLSLERVSSSSETRPSRDSTFSTSSFSFCCKAERFSVCSVNFQLRDYFTRIKVNSYASITSPLHQHHHHHYTTITTT